MSKYRWSNAREWLDWALETRRLTQGEVLCSLLDNIDCDEIQDAFQPDMDDDGYFEQEEDEA